MINLSTPNEILFRELMADKEKSNYWLVKKNGGQKSYDKMRDKLLLEAKRKKCTQISEVFEYRSAKGNRWMTYECARYFPGADSSHTVPYAFCFYETLGSVGAFVPVKVGIDNNAQQDAILIFNSHFFYQMCERLGLGFRSPEMVRAFHEFIPSILMKTYFDEEEKVRKLMVRLPGSIGWGIQRTGTELVYEVRTFLKDSQLNGKQKRITEELREHADKFVYEPANMQAERIKRMLERGEGLGSEVTRLKEKYEVMGMDGDYLDNLLNVSLWVVTVFTKMGLADANDEKLWERHTRENNEAIHNYIVSGGKDGEKFLELLETCAKKLGFRDYDPVKAREVYTAEAQKVNEQLEKLEENNCVS